MERFHDELRQENRGIKRGGLKDSDEHIRKRVRSGDKLEIEYIKDDDWEQMSNALKALEGKNNPQEEISPRKAKWDWAESNEESQDEDSEDDDVEMWGRGYKKQEIESYGDIDPNNDFCFLYPHPHISELELEPELELELELELEPELEPELDPSLAPKGFIPLEISFTYQGSFRVIRWVLNNGFPYLCI